MYFCCERNVLYWNIWLTLYLLKLSFVIYKLELYFYRRAIKFLKYLAVASLKRAMYNRITHEFRAVSYYSNSTSKLYICSTNHLILLKYQQQFPLYHFFPYSRCIDHKSALVIWPENVNNAIFKRGEISIVSHYIWTILAVHCCLWFWLSLDFQSRALA